VSTLAQIEMAQPTDVETLLLGCCGSRTWAGLMASAWPYESQGAVLDASERAFDELTHDDWRQAFAAHARIGEPRAEDERGSAEQAGVQNAQDAERRELADLNAQYDRDFDHVFLICASGLSAAQMLAALRARIGNPPAVEFANACAEQRKITALRLRAMLPA
jgi:2-oxo-4-hydroxy-4-carboxy-5-ureidoimidazoline decarboxylase